MIAEIKCVRMTRDCKYIFAATDDGSILALDAESGEALYNLRQFSRSRYFCDFLKKNSAGTVNSIALSPDDKYVVSGSADNSITIYETKGKSAPLSLERASKG